MATTALRERMRANDVDPSLLRRTPISFDDEAEASRLARRKRNWIANVRYVERGNQEPQRIAPNLGK